MNSNLFITKISLEKDKIEDYTKYPFNIPIVKNFNELEIDSPVTFLVGENGIGKSTFVEAIAINCKMNPEGGSNNFTFSTKDTHSKLSEYMHVSFYNHPKTRYFLRAESFYNVATTIDNDELNEYYKFESLHECSHGESFIKLIKNRFYDHGLYILDEPEAALSPNRQLTLLCLIDELVKKGSQFIIATHSPILISYRNGKILNLDDNFKEIKYEDTDIYQTYKMYLDNYEHMQDKLFESD